MVEIYNARFLLFAIYPALIWLGTSWLFNVLIPCESFTFSPALHDDTVLSNIVRAEYVWGTSIVLVLTACSWTIAFCGRGIAHCQPQDLAARLLAVTALFSVIAVLWLLWPAFTAAEYKLTNCVSWRIFKLTLEGLRSGETGATGLAIILKVLAVGKAFGVVTMLFIAVAACSVLTVPVPDHGPTWEELEDRGSRLRGVLYAGAFALVTVFLSLQAFFAIAEAALPPGTKASPSLDLAELRSLAEGLKVFWGSTLTLVLVAAFVPPSAILRLRSKALARLENPGATPSELDAWMKDKGLIEPWTTQVTKVLAMLSPLLSGPLAEFATRLAPVP